jgi:hypothetical protein
MKIVATVTDVGHVVHAGGKPESKSSIITIPDDQIPTIIKKYFKNREWASKSENRYTYESLHFSLLEEK